MRVKTVLVSLEMKRPVARNHPWRRRIDPIVSEDSILAPKDSVIYYCRSSPGRIPVDGVAFNHEPIQRSVIPCMYEDGPLKLRHSGTACVVQARVAPHLAMMRNKTGCEDSNAIPLRIVSKIVDNRVVGIAIVDVKCSTIHARAVTEERFVLFHNAVVTHPCPNCISSSHTLRGLHSRIPSNIRSNSAVPHTEEHDAVSLHVVHQ